MLLVYLNYSKLLVLFSLKLTWFYFLEITLVCMNNELIDKAESSSYIITAPGHATYIWPACTGPYEGSLDSARIGSPGIKALFYRVCVYSGHYHIRVGWIWPAPGGNITSLSATGKSSWTNWWFIVTFIYRWANYMKRQFIKSEMHMPSNCWKQGEI